MSGEGSRHKSPFEILNTCHEMLKYFVALCFQNPKLCFRNKRGDSDNESDISAIRNARRRRYGQ